MGEAMHGSNGRATSRRTFLRTAGASAGAAAIGGSTLFSGVTAAEDHDGMVVFVYDDSPAEDYTMTYQVHQEFDAPGCVAACPGFVDSGSRDRLFPGQLREMHDDGWEVMSHTIEHRDLGRIPITEDVAEGDTEIYVQSNRAGSDAYLQSEYTGEDAGDPLLFSDGDTDVEATVVGQGGDGDDQYIVLEGEIEASFDVGDDPWVRYTDEFTTHVLEESRAMLEEMIEEDGHVTGYVHPYGRYEGVEEFVPDQYETIPNSRTGRGGFNPEYQPDPLGLVRAYYETDAMDEDDIDAFMQTVASEPDFGILAGHSQFDTLPEERVRYALSAAEEHDVRVVTLQEALAELDVLERPGSTNGDGNGTDTRSDDDSSMGLFERIVTFFQSLFSG